MIRKIHLDFHTHSDVPEVGKNFDPDIFADTLARANVNWLATPGKCDMGNTYFDSTVGHPHPNLVCPDLFPATVKACVARGIQVQAYYCLAWDSHIATIHPDWRQETKEGKHIMWGEGLLCFASPYIDQVVIPGVREIMERCPDIAGFFFDICMYVESSYYSNWFNALAVEQLGGRADDNFARRTLANTLITDCCTRINHAIAGQLPQAVNFFNALIDPGNPLNNALHPIKEMENPILFGGPERMGVNLRWLQGHDFTVLGMPSRFQGPWGDLGTLRTPDQLRFDVARTVSRGAGVTMGDHRNPDGSLDPETYRRIGAIYADLLAADRWLDNATPCREGVLLTEIDHPPAGTQSAFPDETTHAVRILEEGGLQFDLRSVHDPLPECKLVIWTGQKPGNPSLLAELRRHVQNGGALLVMNQGIIGLEDLVGASRNGGATGTTADKVQILAAGQTQSTASGFFRLTPACALHAEWHEFAHIITQPLGRITATPGTTVLAEHFAALIGVLPFSTNYPTSTLLGPAIIQKGKVIYSTVPLAAENENTGTPLPALLLRHLCARLLERPLVRHTAGTTVAAHLLTVRGGYTLHLVHWALDRWGKQVNSAHTFPELAAGEIELALPRAVRRVTAVPSGNDLPFTYSVGVCRFVAPAFRVWQIIGIETE